MKQQNSGGSSMLTLGLLAVGGYFVYEWFFATPATTAAAGGTPSGTFQPTGGGTSASPKIGDEITSGNSIVAVYSGSQWHAPPLTQSEINAVTAQQIAVANQTLGPAPGSATVTSIPVQANCPTGQSYVPATSVGGVSVPAYCAGSTPAAPTSSTLDTIYQALIAAAQPDQQFTGSGSSLTGLPYHWNFYLQRVYSGTIPDVSTLFDVNTPIAAAAFWAVMAPALQSANPGLSGLGCYGGAGAFMHGLGAFAW